MEIVKAEWKIDVNSIDYNLAIMLEFGSIACCFPL